MTLDRDFFIVLTRDQSTGELWTSEQRVLRMSEDDIVADICAGQITDVAHVLRCNPVEHTCDDVTEDIAIRVMAKELLDYGTLTGKPLDFLEQVLGCRDCADAQREWAA